MAADVVNLNLVIDLRDRRLPSGRTLHLVDVENLMGGPRAGLMSVADALDDYDVAVGVQPGDHMVIAGHPLVAYRAGLARPGRCVRAAHGHDGADKALLRDAAVADLARRYDRVVIGSGDGIFADHVVQLRAAGLPVVVVSRPRSLSFALRLATGGAVIYLPDLPRLTA